MSSSTLPDSAAAFADATWADLAPYYEALATRPLDQSNVEGWLRRLVGARCPAR